MLLRIIFRRKFEKRGLFSVANVAALIGHNKRALHVA